MGTYMGLLALAGLSLRPEHGLKLRPRPRLSSSPTPSSPSECLLVLSTASIAEVPRERQAERHQRDARQPIHAFEIDATNQYNNDAAATILGRLSPPPGLSPYPFAIDLPSTHKRQPPLTHPLIPLPPPTHPFHTPTLPPAFPLPHNPSPLTRTKSAPSSTPCTPESPPSRRTAKRGTATQKGPDPRP
jgi:hypothetical protein